REGAASTPSRRLCVRFGCRPSVRSFGGSDGVLQLHHLHGDLDGEPVVAPEVEPGDLADAPEPLAQGVRVHVERLGGRADGAVPAEELLEGEEELRATLLVVVGDLRDRVNGRVANATLDRDA